MKHGVGSRNTLETFTATRHSTTDDLEWALCAIGARHLLTRPKQNVRCLG